MIRARGLLLGGAALATLAGFTIAASSAGAVPAAAVAHPGRVSSSAVTTRTGTSTAIRELSPASTSGRATTLAFVGAASATAGPRQRLDADVPLIPSQEVDIVSPNAGMSGPGGEQEVIITGSGFTGATDVFFGTADVSSTAYPCLSSAAGCFQIDSDTQVEADTPVQTAQTVDVVINGSATGPNDQYSYFDPPTVTNVDSPQDQGATGIAVAGTNFSYPGVTPLTSGVSEIDLNPTAPGSTIKITNTCTGSQPDCFDFEDDSDLTFNLPNSVPAGNYDVQVVTPGGTSATSSADLLTVNPPAPTLTTVAPPAGSTAGGTTVNLTGTDFNTATDVFFGIVDVTSFTINSNTSITVTSPAHAAGGVSVTVENPGGTSGSQPYTFVAPPTLATVAPPAGSTAGGTTVNLTGTNFNTATDVFFGIVDVTSFTINSNTSITVTSPAHAAGGVSVTVENPGGTSGTQPYTFVAPPTLTTVAPPAGSTAGGTTVSLTGTNFTTATDVFFGASDVTGFTINSNTSITVTSPAHAAGGVSVTVENPGGTSGSQPYTFVAPPTLMTVAPPTGSTAGGTTVNLTGTNFNTVTDVFFGTVDVTSISFTINSNTSITVTSPAHAAGQANVTVENAGGTSGSQPYTYLTPPTLTNLNPTSGSTLGGNSVVLTGTDFTGATDVNFGSADITPCGSGTCFTVDSPTQITVDAVPPGAAGSASVTVTTSVGITAPLAYTYVTPPPTLTSLLPTSGSTVGGNSVVLTGTNFTGATDVHVGSTDLTPCGSHACFTINSDTQITVTMPSNAPGIANVNVTTPGGTTGDLTYTYVAPLPTVTGVSPNEGAPAGGNIVTLTGSAFQAAGAPIISTVTVGSATPITVTPCGNFPIAPCFTVNSGTSITIGYLPGGTGQVNITVTNPSGTSATSSGSTYTYNAALPTVTEVSPRDGAMGGGEAISVLGSGFGQAGQDFVTDVFFGNTDVQDSNTYPCPSTSSGCFIVVGPTQLAVYTPSANAARTVDVTVQTGLGVSNPGTADKYTFVAPGAYHAITPYRTCDTRPAAAGIAHNQCNTGVGSNKTLGTKGVVTVQITSSNLGQVPAGAQAVVVNITAIDHSSTSTLITAYPGGASRPLASNINLAGGKVGGNLAIVQLSPGGAINLFNAVGSTDVIVDVEGYFSTPVGSAAGEFHSIPPLRICDSRGGTLCSGATSAPLLAKHWRDVVLSGLPPGAPVGTQSIPASASAAAAVFNLTAVGGTESTLLAVAPALANHTCPTTAPAFSNVNPAAGTALPIRAISSLGPNQDVCIYNALGSINFVVDVNGWFGSASAPQGVLFYSVPPTRVCDTRPSSGTSCAIPAPTPGLTPGQIKLVQIAGEMVVPADDPHSTTPVAVVANLTGIAGTAPTIFTLYPSDAAARPRASDLNPSPGQVIANLAVVGMSTTVGLNEGDVSLYNAAGDINAILDVAGWFQ